MNVPLMRAAANSDRQAEADFGQTDFGQPYLTDFGQNLGGRLRPSRLWPKLMFQSFGNLKKKKTEP